MNLYDLKPVDWAFVQVETSLRHYLSSFIVQTNLRCLALCDDIVSLINMEGVSQRVIKVRLESHLGFGWQSLPV